MILTFGLLSPDKGIEYVIDALPAILARYPDTVYIVLGATHPHVKERHGETYRLMLEHRAQRLGVDSQRDLPRPLRQPGRAHRVPRGGRHLHHAVSQPGADHVGHAGLRGRRGQGRDLDAVPVRARAARRRARHPRAVARSGGDRARGRRTARRRRRSGCALRERAAAHGREHALAGGGASLRRELRARARRARRPAAARSFQAQTLATRPAELPELNLEHVRADDRRHRHAAARHLQRAALRRGLLPRRQRARAAADGALEEAGTDDARRRARARVALSGVRQPRVQPPSADGSGTSCRTRAQWLEECGSEDSHGRALWALGTVVGRSSDPGRQSLAGELFHAALPAVAAFTSPRAWAFALLGIDEYLRAFQGDSSVQSVRSDARRAAARPLPPHAASPTGRGSRTASRTATRACRRRSSSSGAWMERRGDDGGRPAIARLAGVDPALARTATSRRSARTASIERGEPKAAFDQQPVEACAMVSACLEAQRVDRRRALGASTRGARSTGSSGRTTCSSRSTTRPPAAAATALHADRVNENQGAESTLSFLLALLEMRAADRADAMRPRRAARRRCDDA